MTTTIDAQNAIVPMTMGSPIGPEVTITTSAEVDSLLADYVVTFGGEEPECGSARGVHWLAQASADEVIVAAKFRKGGGLSASVYLIERCDDQGRRWFCVKSSWWTAGLFLSLQEALDFAVEVANDEKPAGGWDLASNRRMRARVYARLATRDLM